MKKLIPLCGPEGRAVLELEEKRGAMETALRPNIAGELWLINEAGGVARAPCSFNGSIAGAFIIKEGAVAMRGGFAGKRGLEERALSEILLRSAAIQPTLTSAQPPPAAPPCDVPPEIPVSDVPPAAPPQSSASEAPPEAPVDFVGRSEALFEILKKAKELFDTEASPQQPEPPADTGDAIANPFPDAFPLSRWRRVSYPGTGRYYLEGEMVKNGIEYLIHALPGEYHGGRRGRGFNSFYRARDGSGYWLKITRRS